MSLYSIRGYYSEDEVHIGWDPGFGTFFGQVKGPLEVEPRHWVGNNIGEIKSPVELANRMANVAEISPLMQLRLRMDKIKETWLS
jgi:hypothetical protein